MSKLAVHVILPELPEGSHEAAVAQRALGSLRRQMYPFEVFVHQGDSAYEHAKNPHWNQEAPVYAQHGIPAGTEPSGIQAGYEKARAGQ